MNFSYEKLFKLWTDNKLPRTSLIVASDVEYALSLVKRLVYNIFSQETKISLENHPDFYLIEKIENENNFKKEITIDQIRNAISSLNKTPSISKVKILVIYEADLLNINAANAALKILEEPGKDTYIFLVTYYENAILPTIKSRCAIFYFNSHPNVQENDHSIFFNKNTDELFKMCSELNLKKNLKLWNIYKLSAINIITKAIKISSGIDYNDFFIIKNNIYYLIHVYEKIKEIISNTDIYELDKKQSAIIIYELINDCVELKENCL